MIGIKGIAKKPIIDATAKPADVASGKVFYNNDGKQTGTGTIDDTKSYVVKVSTFGDNSLSFNRNTVDFYYANPTTKSLEKLHITTYDNCGGYYASVTLPQFSRLVGIGIDGIRYDLSMSTSLLICSNKPTNGYTLPSPIMFLSVMNMNGSSNNVSIFQTGSFTFYYK